MSTFFRQAWVVARRDIVAVVGTPTFLLFLLAPAFMLGFGLMGGMGASELAKSQDQRSRIVAIADAADGAALIATDKRMRAGLARETTLPPLVLHPRTADDAATAARLGAARDVDTYAVMYGPLTAPVIAERNADGLSGRYLRLLAEQTLRDRALTGPAPQSKARTVSIERGAGPSRSAQQVLGYGAVFVLFLLTLLLGGQAVGMLAEEKGNKVIEILAAALPLEAVFLGKLLGLLGIAAIFIGFWGTIGAVGAGFAMNQGMGFDATPAVGWVPFALLAAAYFVSAFLVLGAIFLGVGAQASTVREIQMLSLPITLFQVGMFALSSAAANAPGSKVATIAQVIPFSSPFAMAARAATDPALGVHLIALAWQGLWAAAVIALSVRAFRIGVLGGGFRLPRRAA